MYTLIYVNEIKARIDFLSLIPEDLFLKLNFNEFYIPDDELNLMRKSLEEEFNCYIMSYQTNHVGNPFYKQLHKLTDYLLKTHIDYLKKLREQGHLPICGPFVDNKGAVLIIRAESKTEAENLVKNDPYSKENYYQKYDIHEFEEANDENNWLSLSDQTKKNLG